MRRQYSEEVCIAAALADPHAKDSIPLKPADFAQDEHAEIWSAILAAAHVDVFTIGEELHRRTGRDWTSDLMELVTNTPVASIEHHASVVLDLAARRRAAQIASSLIERIARGDDGAIEQAIADLGSLATTAEVESITIGEAARKALVATIERDGKPGGISTGIAPIDRALGGMHAGDLVIIGARPGTGKTALMLQIGLYSATHNVPIGIFSGEMAATQLGERSIAASGAASIAQMRTGHANVERMEQAVELLETMPCWISDVGSPSLGHVRRMARKWVREFNVQIIFLDYLQRMSGDPRHTKTQIVGANAQGLKTLASELQIPIVVLAQINRNVTNRSDPRPNMADLRDSGEIEQEADQIMLLYTDNSDEEADVWDSELILDKNRHGATGVFELSWLRSRMLFRERGWEHHQGE